MKNGKLLKDAVWSDCEHDYERYLFLVAGRGHETGIISRDVQFDFAAAFKFRSDVRDAISDSVLTDREL